MSLDSNQLYKALRFHFGDEAVGNNSGIVTVNGDLPTDEMLASAPQWLADSLVDDRGKLIDSRTLAVILAPLGYTPDQLALANLRQTNMANRANALDRKERLSGLTELETATLAYLLDFQAWVEDVRAHGRARKANPALAENYTSPPTKPDNVIV